VLSLWTDAEARRLPRAPEHRATDASFRPVGADGTEGAA